MSDYVPTIDDLRVKLCFICREEETYDKPEIPPRKWTHPCQCTLLAHEDCLLEWIKTAQTKSSATAAENALKCAQCGAKYDLESDLPPGMRWVNNGLTAWNRSLGKAGKWFIALIPVGLISGVAIGTHFILTQYGAYSVKEFFGEEFFENVLTSDPYNWSISAWINLPLIPVALISYRFNSSFNLFPAISTLLEWPALRRSGLAIYDGDDAKIFSWPPSPFTVGFVALPIVRYLYRKALIRVTRWILAGSSRHSLRRATGDRPVAENAGDDEDRMLMIRIRNVNGQAEDEQAAGGAAEGNDNNNQAAITINASPLGRKVGGALLIPFIARRMGNLLLRLSKYSDLLRRFLAVRPSVTSSSNNSSWSMPITSPFSSLSVFTNRKIGSGSLQPVTWKILLRALWGGSRAWAEIDPVWWRNTIGFGFFVVAKDALNLLHLYLVKREVESRRVMNRDFRDIDVSSLDIMPRSDGRRQSM